MAKAKPLPQVLPASVLRLAALLAQIAENKVPPGGTGGGKDGETDGESGPTKG